MFLPEVPELTLYGVMERGVPNAERIVIQANQDVEMANFGLLLGIKVGDKTAKPVNNRFFWFGSGTVGQFQWIHIYTCDGTPEKTRLRESGADVYALYWGFTSTILNDGLIVPVLFRMDCVTVDRIILPQIGQEGMA